MTDYMETHLLVVLLLQLGVARHAQGGGRRHTFVELDARRELLDPLPRHERLRMFFLKHACTTDI